MTRRCDNCGKELPTGGKRIEVRILGWNMKDLDFCSPKCFEEYFSKTRYELEVEKHATD